MRLPGMCLHTEPCRATCSSATLRQFAPPSRRASSIDCPPPWILVTSMFLHIGSCPQLSLSDASCTSSCRLLLHLRPDYRGIGNFRFRGMGIWTMQTLRSMIRFFSSYHLLAASHLVLRQVAQVVGIAIAVVGQTRLGLEDLGPYPSIKHKARIRTAVLMPSSPRLLDPRWLGILASSRDPVKDNARSGRRGRHSVKVWAHSVTDQTPTSWAMLADGMQASEATAPALRGATAAPCGHVADTGPETAPGLPQAAWSDRPR